MADGVMCPAKDDLRQAALGGLPGEQAELIADHLAGCDRCVTAFESLDTHNDLIDAIRRQPAVVAQWSAQGVSVESLVSQVRGRIWRSLEQTWSSSGPDEATPPSQPTAGGGGYFGFLAAPQSPDEIGRLGGYRVLRMLGSGGMGMVFEAEDPRLRRRVALKVMKPELAVHKEARQRFLREAQAMAALDHDHIVTIYQVGEDAGVPFLAMPFLQGECLAERLKKAEGRGQNAENEEAENPNPKSKIQNPKSLALPLDEVLRIGCEVAHGLSAAHERGLIHRDIKPGNIWLETSRGRPRVKILDFGLARATEGAEELTHSAAVLGTPSYMAPEQARGEVVDARADLFSLGCVLYRMATGRPPFPGNDPLSVLMSLAVSTPPEPRELNADLPVELNTLIVSLLAKDPAGRPSSAVEVAERLASVDDERRQASGVRESVGNALRGVPPSVGDALRGVPGEGVSERGGEGKTEDGLPSPSSSESDGLGRPSSEDVRSEGGGIANCELEVGDEFNPKSKIENPKSAPPPRRRGLVAIAAAFAAAAILAGIIVVIKNKKGEIVARMESAGPIKIKAAADHTVEASSSDEIAPARQIPLSEEKAEGRGQKAENEEPKTQDLSPKTSSSDPKSLPALSPLALVGEPAAIQGLKSWTIETATPRGPIYQAQFNVDGTLVATLGVDGALRLWDAKSGKLVRAIIGPRGPWSAFDWSADGADVACASSDAVRVWQASTGKLLRTWPLEPAEMVHALAWSPNRAMFAVGLRRDNAVMIELVNAGDGELHDSRKAAFYWNNDAHVPGRQVVCRWSPDSRYLAYFDGEGRFWDVKQEQIGATRGKAAANFAWRDDGALLTALPAGQENVGWELWRSDTGDLLHTLGGNDEPVVFRIFSPGAHWLLATDINNEENSHAYVWDTANGELARRCDLAPDGQMYTQYVLSPDGQTLLGYGPRTGNLWAVDVASGRQLWNRPALLGSLWPFVAAWSPAGDALVQTTNGAPAGLARMEAWDLVAGRRRAITPLTNPIFFMQWTAADRLFCVQFPGSVVICDPETLQAIVADTPPAPWRLQAISSDGASFAATHDKQTAVFNAADPEPLKTWLVDDIHSVCFSPDATRVATAGQKSTIWDVATGQPLNSLDSAGLPEWSPDGKQVVYVVELGKRLEVRDAQSGELLRTLDNDPAVQSDRRLAWSPDGSRIAGFGRVWDAATGKVMLSPPRFADWHDLAYGEAHWSPNGDYLAYLSCGRGTTIVEAATGRVALELLSFNEGRAAVVSPSGHMHASPRFENEMDYIAETDAGQETFTPNEFAEKFGWENDPGQVGIRQGSGSNTQRVPGVQGSEEKAAKAAKESGDESPHSKALSPVALVQRPAALPGVESWSLETRFTPGIAEGRGVALSPDGRLLATGGRDGNVRIVEIETRKLRAVLMGHGSQVSAVAWSHDGSRLATIANAAAELILWDTVRGRTVHRLSVTAPGPSAGSDVAWSADDATLAVAGSDVRLVDAASGELIQTLPESIASMSVAWSPKGDLLAAAGTDGVRVWDAAGLRLVHKLVSPEPHAVRTVAWSPDGSRLAAAGGSYGTPVDIWSTKTWTREHVLREPRHYTGHVAWGADGKTLAVDIVNGPTGAQWWDVETEQPVGDPVQVFDQGHVYSLRASHDGQSLAMGAGGRVIVAEKTGNWVYRQDFPGTLIQAAWTRDGRAVAAGGPGQTVVWDPAQRSPLVRLSGGAAVAWQSGSNDALLATADAGVVGRFTRGDRNWLPFAPVDDFRGEAFAPVALSADGRNVARRVSDKTAAIWDLQARQRVRELEIDGNAPVRFAFNSDGSRVCGGGENGACAIWDVQTGKRLLRIEARKQIPIGALAWSPDDERIAAVRVTGGVDIVTVADGRSQVLAPDFGHGWGSIFVRWSQDGGNVTLIRPCEAEISTWQVATAKLLRRTMFGTPHVSWNNAVTGSLDSEAFAIGDPTLRLYDGATGQQVCTMVPLLDEHAAIISADGHYLTTARVADKQLVYVVHKADGQELLSPKEFSEKYGWNNDPSKVVLVHRPNP